MPPKEHQALSNDFLGIKFSSPSYSTPDKKTFLLLLDTVMEADFTSPVALW